MQQLKRVGWQIGQPLLPIHLFAQEDSLLAHLNFYIKNSGIPFYGLGNLKWDDTLLTQGVVSMSKCTLIFPTGEVVDVPDNGKIASFDLNTSGLNSVSLYLHLLKDATEQEVYGDTLDEEEKITYSINQLLLSPEAHIFSAKTGIKLAEFEKNVENRWSLSEKYIPPLFTIIPHPFLTAHLSSIRTILESFQKELELESATGRLFEQRTLETKICLIEVAKIKQFFLNLDRLIITHPFYLYEQLSQFLNTLAFLYVDHAEFAVIPYQHEKLALLFAKQIELLLKYLKPKSEQLAFIKFERKPNCYISEKLPQELHEATEVFFIVQNVDPKTKFATEGLKLASYSRLFNIHRFALSGVLLLRLESAPFNNNFSKSAYVYKLEKDAEWEHALKEGRLAFSIQGEAPEVQSYLYWR